MARELHMAEIKECRKVDAYNSLADKLELQIYLNGPLPLGAKLKFKFVAGSHGLVEETDGRAGANREDLVCEFCVVKWKMLLIFVGNALLMMP
jgi:hypothetical protein